MYFDCEFVAFVELGEYCYRNTDLFYEGWVGSIFGVGGVHVWDFIIGIS